MIGQQHWEFADGRAACEAIVAKLEPAQPRNGKGATDKKTITVAEAVAGKLWLTMELYYNRQKVTSVYQYPAYRDQERFVIMMGGSGSGSKKATTELQVKNVAVTDSPAETDDGLKAEVYLAHEVIVNPIYNSAFQYVAVCDKGVNIPVVSADFYRAAAFTEAMITRWKNNKTSGPFPEPVEIHATKDGRGHFTLVKVVAPQAVLDDQQRRNVPSSNPEPTAKELEAMGDIPF